MDKRNLINAIKDVLGRSVSADYVDVILEDTDENGRNTILDLIVDDVEEASSFSDDGMWSEDDIKFAIGRILIQRLNIYY